ncbi:MAG TPA: prepilin-type N-terminal cleavage/methylation domain-containing protein [Candidatus Acidoferrum sp.]
MKPVRPSKYERGFTLIEILAALGIFLLVTGAAFTLLTSSQQRYQTESQVLNSFQEARLGLDQMVRDINDAGFPSVAFTNGTASSCAVSPFAWATGAGYSPACVSPPAFVPCQIGTAGGGTCFTASGDTAPGDFDLIMETEPNPQDCPPNCVKWIRYQLRGPNGTTLMRGVADKTAGGDPDGNTAAQLVPFVQNVVNNSPNLQIGQFQLAAAYPAVFPAGAPVPIFQYICDTPSTSQNLPQPCPPLAGPDNSPANIRDVMITLIVAAPLPDATTGRPRLVQLAGRGRRINPNQ